MAPRQWWALAARSWCCPAPSPRWPLAAQTPPCPQPTHTPTASATPLGCMLTRMPWLPITWRPRAQLAKRDPAPQRDKNPSETVPFPYDLRYGIDNKLLYGAVAGAASGAGGACGGKGWGTLTPDCAPYLFPQDYTVTGNYMYNCGRVAYNLASGCADNSKPTLASGTQIIDNHSEHCNGGTCWTVDGKSLCRGSDTMEDRHIDITGYCANISANSAHVYKLQVAFSNYATVDGECILAQTENNSPALAHSWTNNDCTHASPSPLASGPIFFYKMINVADSVITGNENDAGEYMGAVFDSTHNGWVKNVCKGNSQPCKCGTGACP